MARPKGAKNKPKEAPEQKPQEAPQIEVKKHEVTAPEVPTIEQAPKPILNNFIEKPQVKPRKAPKAKPYFKPENIQDPVNAKGLDKKYIVLGLIGVSLIAGFFYKDKLIEKIIEIKTNRMVDKMVSEKITGISINPIGDKKE
jgi:hypothetical protein